LSRVEAHEQWERFAQILCSEGDRCLESNGCLRSDHQEFLKMKFAQCLPRAGTESPARGLELFYNLGSLLMRSKLAISALVVTSLFGSTLIASAQNQTAPGASSEGNVSPHATSGKKTQHEKGMTTGSSTRSGTNKGSAATPSDQDNAGSDVDNMAAPKRGEKY
jgi:hypothetical protein